MSKNNIIGNYYDKYSTKNPIEKKLMTGFFDTLQSLVRQTRAASILEVGAGEGHVTAKVQEAAPEAAIVGTEVDLEFTRKNRIHEGPIVVNSLPNLCFCNGSFDLVLLLEVLEHLPEPVPSLTALKNVTREYAIISVPNEPIWRMANMARGKYWKALGNTPGHIQHYSAENLKKILNAEFEILSLRKPFPWLMALCRHKR